MTVGFAMDYLCRKMEEMGVEKYLTFYRHLRVESGSMINIDAANQYFLLIEPEDDVLVYSKSGAYDPVVDEYNELWYDHTGKIQVYNEHPSEPRFVRFIQVVPKRKPLQNQESKTETKPNQDESN